MDETPAHARSLRIGHILNEPFGLDSANGVQQVAYCLSRAQSDLGQSVVVFSRESGIHILAAAAGPPPVSRGAGVTRSRSLRQALLSSYFDRSMFEDVCAWQPDVVHFHSVHIPENVALAAHLARVGVPYCVTVHGGLFHAALRRNRLRKVAFNALFERRYLNGAHFIHAVSPQEVDVIRRHGVNRPIVVVPNGVPPDANDVATRPDVLYEIDPRLRNRRIFMFVGRLDPWQKGLDLLMEAFARAALPDAALVLVGPDFRGSRHALETLAARLEIADRVLFTGPAFNEHRANLMAAAEVFVHPSRWEGLSLSVLMAAAAGKACLISRDADPFGELERAQAAIIVEPTVPSIVAGLERVGIIGAEALQALGANAREVVERHFTWPMIAGRVVEAYRRALAHT